MNVHILCMVALWKMQHKINGPKTGPKTQARTQTHTFTYDVWRIVTNTQRMGKRVNRFSSTAKHEQTFSNWYCIFILGIYYKSQELFRYNMLKCISFLFLFFLIYNFLNITRVISFTPICAQNIWFCILLPLYIIAHIRMIEHLHSAKSPVEIAANAN